MKHTVLAALLVAFVAAPAAAQSDALQVHGYLTQGWADATDHAYLGIPVEPTTDYRSMALQVRYGFTDESAMVIQVNHRRMGTSLLNEAEDDVALDWAFFQHRFGDFSARAGRVPMPRGLYNEVRDVGVLLPFYRAPYQFYTESGETLDGVTLSHHLSLADGWAIESHAFAGEQEQKQISYDAVGNRVLALSRSRDLLGAQVWLFTPVEGIRVGAGAQRFESDNPGYTGQLDPKGGSMYQVSADGRFDRVRFAAEWERFAPGAFDYDAWYVSGGVRLVKQLWLNGQVEAADVTSTFQGVESTMEYARDYAAGISFALNPQVVFKLEGHQVEGFAFETDTPLLEKGESRYLIASISTAF